MGRERRRVWLLSAYRSASHGSWADALVAAHPELDWTLLELPGRHFRWRIRGNPLSWLDRLPEGRPDLLLVTSMVDLATLRGLHPRLAGVPAVYYFHENQFAYPVSHRQVESVDPQMVQLYGALAADRLVFNSAWNQDSFLAGVAALLARLPDAVPAGVVERLARKSSVLPVPVQPVPPGLRRDPDLVLWNHRWEYDKAPEVFVEALLALARQGPAFRLALLGPRAEPAPEPLSRLRGSLETSIVVDGRLDRDAYRSLLGRAGVVVSTARHEFQGLAMLEAASAGARPLVPDALCYPEQYPPQYRYPPGDARALAGRLGQWLGSGLPPAVDVTPWLAPALAWRWRELLTGSGEGR